MQKLNIYLFHGVHAIIPSVRKNTYFYNNLHKTAVGGRKVDRGSGL